MRHGYSLRGGMVITYLIFAVAFGGMGFGVFFFLMLPEIMAGEVELLFPAFMVLLIFGGVGVGMGVAFVKTVLCGIRCRRTLMYGTDGVGTYIDSSSNMSVNNIAYYKLTFSFRDATGYEHIVKTRSRYYQNEVDILRERGTFEIKFIGNHAVPTANAFKKHGGINRPQASSVAVRGNSAPPVMISCSHTVKTRKTCDYCGGESEIERSRCMFCGSHRFTNIEQYTATVPTATDTHAPAPVTSVPKQWKDMTPEQQARVAKVAKIFVSVIVAMFVLPFIFAFVFGIIGAFRGNFNSPTPVPTSYHTVNETVRTDWFNLKIIRVAEVRTDIAIANLPNASHGYKRYFVEVSLQNYRLDEVLEMNLGSDFYIETFSAEARSINTGGGYGSTYYDCYGEPINNGTWPPLFLGTFMVSCGNTMQGVIVYDIPNSVNIWYFIYEEREYDGDTPLDVKHIYKFSI